MIVRLHRAIAGPYAIIALLAAAIIGLELIQVRILSALYYSQSVYFTVTIALMGFGIAGVTLSLFAARKGSLPAYWLLLFTGLFSFSTPICLGIVSRFPLWTNSAWPPLGVYLLLTIPFFCGGMAVGLLLLFYGSQVRKLYAADLAASAIAAILVLLLLRPLGAPALVWGCTLLSCASLLLQTRLLQRNTRHAVLFAALVSMAALSIGHRVINYWPGPYKNLYSLMASARAHHVAEPLEAHAWTPIARIDIVTDGPGKMLTQDGGAPSALMPPGDVDRIFRTRQMNFAPFLSLIYKMNPENRDALVIGIGGGRDIVTAKAFGAQNIKAVEVNAATYDFMTGRYAQFLKWPLWPDVKAYRAEGRYFVHRQPPESFDKITMSGIDTYAASNSGAHVLTENYLYTVEAMQDYLHALKPNGIMVSVRWLLFNPVARESIRIASNFLEAAKREGIMHPEQCIFVTTEDVGGNHWAETFVKKTPFTPAEIRIALQNTIGKAGAVIYLPKVLPTDEQLHMEQVAYAARGKELSGVRKAYLNLINAPSEEARETFLKDYPFDITPSYDDKPFFFQDTKWFDTRALASWDSTPIYRLYSWLGVTMFVALIGMVGPLFVFNANGLSTPHAPWLLTYFASLGLGFMIVEVGLMQRLAFYLGDPMYSLVVILGGLLFFAGTGSYLSSSVQLSIGTLMKLGTFMVAVVLLAWLLIVPALLAATFLQPFWLRTLVVLVTLLPLGVAMGIPFASGLAHLERINPNFIPWAWGINGLTSVLASILAVILAMSIGFTAVLAIGALTYFLGYVAISVYQRRIKENPYDSHPAAQLS